MTSPAEHLPRAASDPDKVIEMALRVWGYKQGEVVSLPPSRLDALCRDAGFHRFQLHDVDDPANLYYEVRP